MNYIIPKIGNSVEEIWKAWKNNDFEIHANFTGLIFGFSVHQPNIEYSFDWENKVKKSWKVNGITVCDYATENEINNILNDIQNGAFQIVYASPRGVDSNFQKYMPKRKYSTIHQATGKKIPQKI